MSIFATPLSFPHATPQGQPDYVHGFLGNKPEYPAWGEMLQRFAQDKIGGGGPSGTSLNIADIAGLMPSLPGSGGSDDPGGGSDPGADPGIGKNNPSSSPSDYEPMPAGAPQSFSYSRGGGADDGHGDLVNAALRVARKLGWRPPNRGQ